MQEILDMHDLNQHIHTQTHKFGNTLDWLISNTANTIQDIINKDYLLDHSIIEWKFQISRKVSENIQKSRRDLTKINEENNNNYMEAIKKTMDKLAPLTTKMKTKKDHNPWFNKDSQKLKCYVCQCTMLLRFV